MSNGGQHRYCASNRMTNQMDSFNVSLREPLDEMGNLSGQRDESRIYVLQGTVAEQVGA